MPKYQEPMKDVESCEKLRVAAHERWSVDVRMGKPSRQKVCYHMMNT